jgi:hypothetical protein
MKFQKYVTGLTKKQSQVMLISLLFRIIPPVLLAGVAIALLFLSGCSTSSIVDEQKSSSVKLELAPGQSIVILGRRHGSSYETEPDFINCISNNIANTARLSVIQEQVFLDAFYPWFEPRVAPLKLPPINKVLNKPIVAKKIKKLGVRYMVWVDGSTEIADEKGSITCGMTPSGGCLGFKSWDKLSSYEATIWDLKHLTEKGKVKVDSKGSSYVIGVVAPIPLIAQVKDVACKGISDRLKGFFDQ